MGECIFCRIAGGDLPADVVYFDDEIVAFHDRSPRAPVHILVIPRRHIDSLGAAAVTDRPLLGRLLQVAAEVAHAAGIGASGFRVVTNTGAGAGQSVAHLHLHVLGGRQLGWPPG